MNSSISLILLYFGLSKDKLNFLNINGFNQILTLKYRLQNLREINIKIELEREIVKTKHPS